MKNNINIAELLKDCPQGMELNCTIFEGLEFDAIIDNEYLPIRCRIKNPNGGYTVYNFTKYGCWLDTTFAKCVIFPKGKTTWEGFQRPFKDGDIVFVTEEYSDVTYTYVAIIKQIKNEELYVHCYYCYENKFCLCRHVYLCDAFAENIRFATEKEKEKLFQAIKDNGYKWNAKTKTLEELPKFKDGDIVVDDSGAIFIYKQIHTLYKEPYADFYCGLTSESKRFKIKTGEVQRCGEISSIRYATEEEKQMLFDAIKASGYKWNPETKTLDKLPKFKVGDKIRHKKNTTIIKTIGHIYDDGYALYDGHPLFFKEQDEWELVPNKFDINTLKPFESKVLVRNDESQRWLPAFWGYKVVDGFITTFGWCKYCIPYKDNKYLLGNTDDCKDFYKTWEE